MPPFQTSPFQSIKAPIFSMLFHQSSSTPTSLSLSLIRALELMDQRAEVTDDQSCNQSDEEVDLRRGPWTVDEDFTLITYVAHHGEGRWNSLARFAGLKRTGKSCRLRWLNYLSPDVRRGNITLDEQLLILELHSRWGNRWSKIAQHLPGRTDNEIKNYWRTRVQKHAKQLRCDVNSKQFKDAMRYLWMPRLVEKIEPAAASTSSTNLQMGGAVHSQTPENSSESLGTAASDLTECYNDYPINQQGCNPDNRMSRHDQSDYLNSQGLGLVNEQPNRQWMDGGYPSENLWNVDEMWFLQQQFNNNV